MCAAYYTQPQYSSGLNPPLLPPNVGFGTGNIVTHALNPSVSMMNDDGSVASSVTPNDNRTGTHSKQKKRSRDGAVPQFEQMEYPDDEDDKKNRGNYRCSRCNLPKKGHICPFQPQYRRKEQLTGVETGASPILGISSNTMRDSESQAELDPHMTVRALGDDLSKQGLPESYAPLEVIAGFSNPLLPHDPQQQQTNMKMGLGTLNDSFQHIRMDS